MVVGIDPASGTSSGEESGEGDLTRDASDWPNGPRGGDDGRPFRPAEGKPGYECDWLEQWIRCPYHRCRSSFHHDTA